VEITYTQEVPLNHTDEELEHLLKTGHYRSTMKYVGFKTKDEN
jgi:hypothetical protein